MFQSASEFLLQFILLVSVVLLIGKYRLRKAANTYDPDGRIRNAASEAAKSTILSWLTKKK